MTERELTPENVSEALGLGWTNAVHPDDREHAAAVFTRANRDREPFSLDYRLRRHDGLCRRGVRVGERDRYRSDPLRQGGGPWHGGG